MWALLKLYVNLFQAAVSALEQLPIVNAVIDGDDIIYRDYIDISIAVGTPKVCLYYVDSSQLTCIPLNSNLLT